MVDEKSVLEANVNLVTLLEINLEKKINSFEN